MSKVLVTKAALKAAYPEKRCVKLGYCEMQEALGFFEPMYYTTGIYGWNFDGFVFDDFLLTTGYRNMMGCRPSHNDIEICKTECDRAIEKWKKGLLSMYELKNELKGYIYLLCYRTHTENTKSV